MATIKLPLEPLVLSINIEREPGPELGLSRQPLSLDYSRLDTETLQKIAPEHVISWLFCERYDAYDVAQILSAAKFRGTYHAAAPNLPKQELVKPEIRACFPELNFRLVSPVTLSRRAAYYYGFIANATVDRTPVLV